MKVRGIVFGSSSSLLKSVGPFAMGTDDRDPVASNHLNPEPGCGGLQPQIWRQLTFAPWEETRQC
jgi:hypothetical protein